MGSLGHLCPVVIFPLEPKSALLASPELASEIVLALYSPRRNTFGGLVMSEIALPAFSSTWRADS